MGLPDTAIGPSKRGGSNAKLGVVAIKKIAMIGTSARKYVVVPQHGPLSLYTKLEGPSIAELDSYLPQYRLWMICKGP
jgi:hypothetical protein